VGLPAEVQIEQETTLNRKTCAALLLLPVVAFALIAGCSEPGEPQNAMTREEAIPDSAVKVAAQDDAFPPVLHGEDWYYPVPMEGPINTAGAEDSPFITPDGDTFFFFFTPDVDVPATDQVTDGVTGIWWSRQINDAWTEPERVVLSDALSLEGCPCARGDTLWFCSVRAGNYGEVDFYTAEYEDGVWGDWENAGEQLNGEYSVGELHVSADGDTVYFGWDAPDGFGGMDIWSSQKVDGTWGEPVNLGPTVNSNLNEDLPFLSSDGEELWFSGQSRLGYPGPAVYRSLKSGDGSWGEAEEVISLFAAEPTLDDKGNIYFAHHFFDQDGAMVEVDIYMAYHK